MHRNIPEVLVFFLSDIFQQKDVICQEEMIFTLLDYTYFKSLIVTYPV